MKHFFALLFFSLVLNGCVTAPTKVKQSPERKREGEITAISPSKITPETIIVDARSAFDYSMAHVPRSINMQWRSFTEQEPEQRGILQKDLFAISRRLAHMGISPSSHVVVVGNGFRGDGEEGRIAWMLAYLGVSNVQFAELGSMKFRLTNLTEDNPPPSIPIWKPEPLRSLNATRDEVVFAINQKAMHRPASYRAGSPPVLYRFIDVRSADDYLGRDGFGARYKVPNMEAVNIPWREFFHLNMHVKKEMAAKLKEIEVFPQHRIIVLGEDGVSSAAVTLALRALGFSNAANYSGGLTDLLSTHPPGQ